jgi:creatinine amidohydrolase
MLLSTALSGEIEEYLKNRDTVLIPCGSLEQHGEAAPLACDTIIPVKLCREAGEKTHTAVAPAITYGFSENHMAFAGTVTLRSETLAAIARDVATSLYAHGFRKMIFLSGHGGNRAALERGLVEAMALCPDAYMNYVLYRNLPGAVQKQKELFCPDPGYHVTVTEVSMVWPLLGLDMPEFRRRKFPPEPSPGEILSRGEWRKRYPEGGAGSDLKFVSVEKGKEFFEFLVESLCEYIRALEKPDVR